MMEPLTTPCVDHDLLGDVHDGHPDVHVHRDALCMPMHDPQHRWTAGVYDRSGRLLLQPAQFHGTPPFRKIDANLVRPLNGGRLPPAGEGGRAIFGGFVADHFGHCITELLGGLWYAVLAGLGPADRILFQSPLDADEIWAIPWLRRILTLAGLDRTRLMVAERPMRFAELVVPGPAFAEDGFVFAAYAEAARTIGRRCTPTEAPAAPVYLARSRLGQGNLRIENEDELIAPLERAGVRIVHPETLDFDAQVALHASPHPLLGFVGSAFHASIFVEGSSGVILSPDPQVRRSYRLMDAVSGARFRYAQVAGLVPSADRGAFNHSFRLADPAALADALLRLMPA